MAQEIFILYTYFLQTKGRSDLKDIKDIFAGIGIAELGEGISEDLQSDAEICCLSKSKSKKIIMGY